MFDHIRPRKGPDAVQWGRRLAHTGADGGLRHGGATVADYDTSSLDFELLRCERSEFETRYGVDSSRLMDAFRLPDGDIDDNADFRRWYFIQQVLERLVPAI